MKLLNTLAVLAFLNSICSPAIGQESLLERLKRVISEKPTTGPARQPQIRHVTVPGPLPDLGDQSCSRNPMLKNAQIALSEEKRKSDQTQSFFDDEPIQKISGISSVQLQGSVLSVNLASLGKFEEFAAPVVNVFENKQFEARPGSALFVHALTLGIGLLVAPVRSAQHALGCTDTRVIRREVSLEESVPTGKVRWSQANAVHVVTIEGLGVSRTFNFSSTTDGSARPMEVDLLPLIMQLNPVGPTDVKVTCVSCNSEEATQVGIPAANLVNKTTLREDFSEARTLELARLERKSEETRVELQRQLSEKESVLSFKRSIVGRWANLEICLRSKHGGEGLVFQLDSDNRLSLWERVLQGEQVVEQYAAHNIEVRAANIAEKIWELKLNVRGGVSVSRMLPRTVLLVVRDDQLQILDQREGGESAVASETRRATARGIPALSNCAHPRVMAKRTQLERDEQERLKRAQVASDLRRQQIELEEAERKRREQERSRLYKL